MLGGELVSKIHSHQSVLPFLTAAQPTKCVKGIKFAV